MARTLKLPPRANALVYADAEVADIIVTLDELPTGEGVVVDDPQDTEPKARARCRTMAKAIKEGVKGITLDDFDDPDVRAAVADSMGMDEGDTDEFDIPGVKVRTHVVQQGAEFVPVVSLKPAA